MPETRVGTLEAMLQETQLRERDATERLAALDRVANRVVASVSHELRTPLTSILGYLEILSAGEVGEVTADQRRVLDRIGRNGRRLHTLIEDLLLLSRIEETPPLAGGEVNLAVVLRRALESLEPTLAGRRLELGVHLGAADLGVAGDAYQLERAVANLIGNAVKFTPDGGRISVELVSGLGRCTLTVSDTGPGIPALDLPHVFERFYRAASSDRAAVPGTGLGLAIVREAAQAHGGMVSASSSPEGSSFVLTLPTHGAPGAA